jgi:hypothetical protein
MEEARRWYAQTAARDCPHAEWHFLRRGGSRVRPAADVAHRRVVLSGASILLGGESQTGATVRAVLDPRR